MSSPVPGWGHLDASTVEGVASTETRIISAATNQSIKVAVEGWRSGRSNIIIIISRFPEDVPAADQNARQAVISACTTATNNPDANVTAYVGLPNASEATCTGKTSSGTTYSVDSVSWAKRNVFVLIVSAGLPSVQVEAIASSQDVLLPSSGVSLKDDGPATALIGGVLVATVIALVIVVPVGLFIRSRRKQAVPVFAAQNWTIAPGGDWSVPVPPAASPMQPGWQAVAGDPHRQAYWDGSRWTAQKRWDGTNWIDV